MPVKRSNNKKKISENVYTDVFFRTLLFSLIAYAASFLIFCLIAYITDLNDKFDFAVSLLSFAVGSFVTGFFAGKKLGKNGLVFGAVFSLPINLIIIFISLISNNFSTTPNIIITAVLLLVSSASGGVVAVNTRYRRRG